MFSNRQLDQSQIAAPAINFIHAIPDVEKLRRFLLRCNNSRVIVHSSIAWRSNFCLLHPPKRWIQPDQFGRAFSFVVLLSSVCALADGLRWILCFDRRSRRTIYLWASLRNAGDESTVEQRHIGERRNNERRNNDVGGTTTEQTEESE